MFENKKLAILLVYCVIHKKKNLMSKDLPPTLNKVQKMNYKIF